MIKITTDFDKGKIMKQMTAVAEKKIKEQISAKVFRVAPSVRVSFTGSLENKNLKASLSGPDEAVAKAKKFIEEK